MIELTYPKFCFLDDDCHQGNILRNRNVVLHIPTMTIIEFLHTATYKKLHIDESYIRAKFVYNGVAGEEEIIAVVYKTEDEDVKDIEEVVTSSVKWYTDYLTWEDKNIIEDGI